jgi:bifunctional oligoribonuclease and PAP phosphatase NrnA
VNIDAVSQIVQRIVDSKRVVVVSHTNPDADAYGSSCGLALGLIALGKDVVVHNDDGFVPRYGAIPGSEKVRLGAWNVLENDDTLIVCDCGGAERVGDALVPALKSAPFVINIDHHTSNSSFGNLNYVVEGISSTSELVYNLLCGLESFCNRSDLITSDVANCLLAGIMGDTGFFKYSSTSSNTFLVAHDLLKRGAQPALLAQDLFGNQSLARVRLQASAISDIVVYPNGFAEVVVTQEMLQRFGAEVIDAEGLAEEARDIEGVKVSALYKQDVDLWRVSLRSRQGVVDCSQIAQSLGGGGHKAAAAFRWRGTFEDLRASLRSAIEEAL